MKNQRHMIAALEGEYRRYKALGEGTFSQLQPGDLSVKTTPESLSIAMIVWHISGNLESRERRVERKEMLAKWEKGWAVLFAALAGLTDEELTRTVTVRGISATVGEALERSLAHTSYHVGQITFLGKMLRRSRWKYLSIPPGKSAAYNANPSLEKSRSPAVPAAAPKSTASRKAAAKTAGRPKAKKPAPRKVPTKASSGSRNKKMKSGSGKKGARR
jgi:hypothetical protein